MAKILLVEDDPDLASRLKDWFTSEKHMLETASTGEDGLQLLTNFEYEVVLLDWTLPGMSGLDVCKRYRSTGGTSFVIFLTGKDDIASKEQALDCGADDYIVKPFDARELSARIRSVMRRPASLLPTELRIGDVALDPQSRIVSANGKSCQLMPKEAALLEFFMRHPNRVYGSKNLLDAVWSSEAEASTETVRSWLRNLRQKLAKVGVEELIKTIPGSGYLIEYRPE